MTATPPSDVTNQVDDFQQRRGFPQPFVLGNGVSSKIAGGGVWVEGRPALAGNREDNYRTAADVVAGSGIMNTRAGRFLLSSHLG